MSFQLQSAPRRANIRITYIMIHNVSDYVEEIFNSMLGADEKKLDAARDALVKMTPAPMSTMLEKQPKEEAMIFISTTNWIILNE